MDTIKIKLTVEQLEGITNLVESIDKNLRITYYGQGLYHSNVYDNINIPIYDYVLLENTKPFLQFLNDTFDYDFTKINIIVLSLLHEIGHYMTMDDELLEERLDELAKLDFLSMFGIWDADTLNYKYFQIPGEIDATAWAVHYYIDNFEKCNNLAKLF